MTANLCTSGDDIIAKYCGYRQFMSQSLGSTAWLDTFVDYYMIFETAHTHTHAHAHAHAHARTHSVKVGVATHKG